LSSQDGAIYLLRELKIINMSLETLQSTRIGMSVNAVRKQSSEEEVQTLAKSLIKSWKKLLDGAEGKAVEEKRREGSPLSKKQQLPEPPKTPTTPTTPTTLKFTSFPPTPVTTDSVRTKCRELLVAALQTDGETDPTKMAAIISTFQSCIGSYSAFRKYSHPLTFSTFCCYRKGLPRSVATMLEHRIVENVMTNSSCADVASRGRLELCSECCD
uniref:Transcription elongation factor A (SII), 2 n=1 Tax=Hucho hucho TaxID=62062 RepID=A0A4W5JGD3_9TELE